jgi:hypothetical protein
VRAVLAAGFLLVSAIAQGAQMERPTLEIGKRIYTLHPFAGVGAEARYFGVYQSPQDLGGGAELHLFPNGRFVVAKTGHAGNDELLGAGTHRVDGDHLELRFERSAHPDIPKRFADLHIQYGVIQGSSEATGSRAFVIGKDDWHAMLQGETRARYQERIREYRDPRQALEQLERFELLERRSGPTEKPESHR